MIKIKDYIFNENDIHHIGKKYTTKTKELYIYFNNGHESMIIEEATFEDIEWNYGSQVEEHKRDYDLLIERHNKLFNDYKELEEENKKLKENRDKVIECLKEPSPFVKNSDLIRVLKGEENEE